MNIVIGSTLLGIVTEEEVAKMATWIHETFFRKCIMASLFEIRYQAIDELASHSALLISVPENGAARKHLVNVYQNGNNPGDFIEGSSERSGGASDKIEWILCLTDEDIKETPAYGDIII